MKKKFELKEMWFNNMDSEVLLTGILHKEFLQYETKVHMPIDRLNALVNLLQKNNDQFDLYDHMCCFNLGFVTEYNVVLPAELNRMFTQSELEGEALVPLKQICA
jgi:hypothetical protein